MSREANFWHDYVLQHPGHAVFTFDQSHAFGAAVCLFLLACWTAVQVQSRCGECAAAAAATRTEVRTQAELLHDIVGNPFLSAPVDLVWSTPAVKSLAAAIYEERNFELVPVLADALEEAGCSD